MEHLDKAFEILEGVKGQPLDLEERKKLAVQLASLMLHEASSSMSFKEKRVYRELSKLMQDPIGKAFTMSMTDECFRSTSCQRVASQMIFLLNKLGIPNYFSPFKKTALFLFRALGPTLSQFLVPLAMKILKKQTSEVILPGEIGPLTKHLKERKAAGVRQNLNHLGEAILSESEAKRRLHIYLEDLQNPDIDYVSIKVSTIFSQINLLSFDDTVEQIVERLRPLYRRAMEEEPHKFVNLDMEEYRDLDLTVATFQKILNEPEFFSYSAGIVLQAYLPDSFLVQKKLTQWAQKRVENGGAPIKIRIVKGANLAMEQFEASSRGWAQTPYTLKSEVDANYKKMVSYGCILENARSAHLGIASHNLFDIAYAMLLRKENQVEPYSGFEMLEGMADHIRRVVQKLSGDMLLYCPVAKKEDFQHAIAYLIRRLDENTGAENFLRYIFDLKPGTENWDAQSALFEMSCDEIEEVFIGSRRVQNRQKAPLNPEQDLPFDNEPDTDFSLSQNRKWAEGIASHWKKKRDIDIPLVIAGKETFEGKTAKGYSPNEPVKPLYTYRKASKEQIEEALKTAKAYESKWANTSIEHRSLIFARTAQILRERRGELIGAMMIDGGKTISESDPEVSEAIDFAEYYRRQMAKLSSFRDISWEPKGTILVASPWNFPCAIPLGGITAALLTGNCVLFKPSSDTVLVAWHLVCALWDAGIPKEALQFVPCSGEEGGSALIEDERIDAVILTGGTSTAKKFLKMRPSLDLAAETGGKNAIVITALADRDLAIKDLLHSAFGHVGQKCSAASLAILEKEVYDDPHFLRSLKEAAESLKMGPSWDLSTRINPLIHEPRGELKKGLTTLEEGEKWLLEPRCSSENPALWSPGIKIGVKRGSFTHQTELFGPVLGIMRAETFEHAIELANDVDYGLTSGLQSLDEREQLLWMENIEAGNLYINRGITGAVVRRQPFGGCKASNIGGGSKAGGPNYLREFLRATQTDLPQEKHPVNQQVNNLTGLLTGISLSAEELGTWAASIANYSYWWRRMRQDRDPSKIVGQDNLFRYVPRKKIVLRLQKESNPLDGLRVCAAALSCEADLTISCPHEESSPHFAWDALSEFFPVISESQEHFLSRVKKGEMERIRIIDPIEKELFEAASLHAIPIITAPVLANGRFELLHYVREVSISIDYHRYGNLGLREGELRKPIL